MRGILSKFTKQIHIEQYFSVLLKPNYSSKLDLHSYFEKAGYQHSQSQTSKHVEIKRVILTQHAFQRWNERVANSNDQDLLQNKLTVLHHLNRIGFLNHELGIIDKEILFTYEQQGDSTIITTFYGRISQKPVLSQFDALRNFNYQNDDFIDLSLDDKQLSILSDPPIPTLRMIFRGNTSKYLIDKYSDGNHTLFILLVLDGVYKGEVRIIDSSFPECEKIEKSVRQALILLGQEEFIYNHIQFHYPEELNKRMQKLSGK